MPTLRQVKTWEFPLQDPSNYYIVEKDGVRILVDAGAKPLPQSLIGEIDGVLITHWHWDHTYGITSLRGKTICAHPRTIEKLDVNRVRESVYRVVDAMGLTIEQDSSLSFLETMIARYKNISRSLSLNHVETVPDCKLIRDIGASVIECPGHTDDHICILIDDVLFVGDTIVPGESPTLLDYNSFQDSMLRILGDTAWARIAPGHGPITGRSEVTSYIREVIARKNKKMYKLLAFLSRQWTDFNTLLRAIYGIDPTLVAYVAARTLIGYLAAAENAGIIEVDRESRPWRVRVRV